MKITKTASGKRTIKLSKNEWKSIGKKAGWMKTSSPELDEGMKSCSDLSNLLKRFKSIYSLIEGARTNEMARNHLENSPKINAVKDDLALIISDTLSSTDEGWISESYDAIREGDETTANEATLRLGQIVERLNSLGLSWSSESQEII